MTNRLVIGAQWGDEGKGKVVDLLAGEADLVIRYAGGHNAGHTLNVEGKRLVLHLVPSGVLQRDATLVLGDGMVLDPGALLAEIDELATLGVAIEPSRLRVSLRAHLILPYHYRLDELQEQASALGTTRRGIGPAYEDKVARRGIRAADLRDATRLARRLEHALGEANGRISRLGGEEVALDTVYRELQEQGERLLPYLDDVSLSVHRALREGKRLLLEGAQGALLDIDQGTYPYVTSSSTLAGGALAGVGLGPSAVHQVIGVAKAYATRVGAGPFPSEMLGAEGERLRRIGAEFGATTGRPRRCGWLDLPALRYAARVSGMTSLALTKLDVVAGLGQLQVCEAYCLGDRVLEEMPAEADELAAVHPVLRTVPGFDGELGGARTFEELPTGAREYVELIERELQLPVSLISVGPQRRQTLRRGELAEESPAGGRAAR